MKDRIEVTEVWDKDPDKNKPRYLPGGLGNADFIALRQVWTGTEFCIWLINAKELKHRWLLRIVFLVKWIF